MTWEKINIPPIPTLLTPINKAINQTTNVTLTWDVSLGFPDCTGWHLQLSDNINFSGTLIDDDDNLTTASKEITGLTAGVTYYWRVKSYARCWSKNNVLLDGKESEYSEVFSFTTAMSYSEADIFALRIIHNGAGVASDGINGWFISANNVVKVTPAGVEEATYILAEFSDITDIVGGNGEFWLTGIDNSFNTVFGKISTSGVFTNYTSSIADILPAPNSTINMLHDGASLWLFGNNTTDGNILIAKFTSGGVFTPFSTIYWPDTITSVLWDGSYAWCLTDSTGYGYAYKISSAGVVIEPEGYALLNIPRYTTYLNGSIYFNTFFSPYDFYKILSDGSCVDITAGLHDGVLGNDGTEIWTGVPNDDKVYGTTIEGVQTEYDLGLPPPSMGGSYHISDILYSNLHIWIAYYTTYPG
jgi:hypothetical protein